MHPRRATAAAAGERAAGGTVVRSGVALDTGGLGPRCRQPKLFWARVPSVAFPVQTGYWRELPQFPSMCFGMEKGPR
jgi:hypothetical protein